MVILAEHSAEQIAEALGGRRNGTGWMCHCPAHDDRTPSLSIADGERGPLVHCHAGCPQDAVIAELRERGLWPAAERKSPPARSQAAVAPPTSWVYTREDGEPVLRVTRHATADGGKTFRQAVPDGTGWRFGGLPRGTPPPLYSLPLKPGAVILLVEGEKARDAAAAALQGVPGFAVSTWPGGCANARHVDLAPLQGRVVVLWPDADPPGIQAMATVAQRLTGIAKAVHVVDVADLPRSHDAADLEPGEVRRRVLAAVQSQGEPDDCNDLAPRYRLLGSEDLRELPPLAWRVRGVLPASGVAALYGPSASGKSFLALDVAAAIAEGRAWFGCRVTPAPVVYVCLEGETGFRLRVAAWEARNGRPLPTDLGVVLQSFRLTDPRDVLDVAAVVPAGGALFLDTLNRAAPLADENSSRDMGAILEAVKALRDATDGLVVLIHHTGKDTAKGLRGHSSLFAAMDAAVEVSRNDDRREWRVAKSKDGADGLAHPFRLSVVELGTDEHGDPVTSCVVEADQAAQAVAAIQLPRGGNQRLVMDALRPILARQSPFSGEYPPCVPPGRVAVELEAVLPEVAACLTCASDKRTSRARDAITGLINRRVYGFREGWLWRI